MTLTQRAECQMAHWRQAADKLPAPERGEFRISDGVRFSAALQTDRLGRSFLSWEVCEQHWVPTGVTFGLWPA